MRIERALMNPLISPLHVTPSSPDMQVVSAFNAAATSWEGETILLLRVAEIPKDVPNDEVAVPICGTHQWEGAGQRPPLPQRHSRLEYQ